MKSYQVVNTSGAALTPAITKKEADAFVKSYRENNPTAGYLFIRDTSK